MLFRLKDLDELIEEAFEEEMESVLVRQDSDQQIWREQSCIYIEALDIDIYAALGCDYNEETREYEVSYSFYLFYDHGTTSEIYWEIGSALPVCIYNYAHGVGRDDLKNISDIEALMCVYLPNGCK